MPTAYSKNYIDKLAKNEVFVFGSNLAGRHGKGAALIAARKFGAERGVGAGPTGQCYALPTKDHALRRLGLDSIERAVGEFIAHARANPQQRFLVTKVGCGEAGYEPAQIAPFFRECQALPNVSLPAAFTAVLQPVIDS